MAIVMIENGVVFLKAPFHPDLGFRARLLRGRWTPDANAWSFEREYEHNVRSLCMSLWGVDGYPERFEDLVALEIIVCESSTPTEPFYRANVDLYLGGRHLAGVLRKPRIARVGKQVTYIKGGPIFQKEGCGWWLQIPAGTHFVVHDVPRMAVPFFERCLEGRGVLRLVDPTDKAYKAG
ncbi:hypothetical protein [Asaia sp. As-1742]|uniref:hypothetical protein n=1 Tax=Asaia sp. As-1742 TaxID=2608325 RepID=UPI00141EBA17|nr:hypothetical protein [Asaia sp. As-1742]NIE81779.1 hypothetical protein [Asaia sp. As-1742]